MPRRNYFIKKKFQVKFISTFVILLIIEALLTAGLILYISNNTITAGYRNSALRVESTARFFFVPLIFIILIVGIAIGLAAMIVFILLSHRLAGPLYRFEQDLSEVALGDLTKKICIRKTDELNKLKETLNTIIGMFEVKMSRMQNNISEAEYLLSHKNLEEADIEKIRKVIKILKNEIHYFKLSSGPKK